MLYSVDDLVINDSFIAYCVQQNVVDMAVWDQYLEQYPEALPTVEEARLLVLGLKVMLQKKQNELSAGEDKAGHALYIPEASVQQLHAEERAIVFPNKKKWALAVSAVACVIIGLGLFYAANRFSAESTNTVERLAYANVPVQSRSGELKPLVLPDNSTIMLNAGSSIMLSKDFGSSSRDVYLNGEALFDVTHNKDLPFIVHVKNYKVKVLGTKFNVKAYNNDAISETSLLEGSVQIILNRNGKDEVYKTLQINQKFVIKADSTRLSANATEINLGEVVPMSYFNDKQAIETAWAKDLLIFEGRSMKEIKNILERKFGVVVLINDKDVEKYIYSANFTNEPIDEVLKALQLSYPFNYKKEGNIIIINK